MTIARCSRFSMILLTINMSQPITITSLTTVRDHGRETASFVENGALVVCEGWLTRFSFEGANIIASKCVSDSIYRGGFES